MKATVDLRMEDSGFRTTLGDRKRKTPFACILLILIGFASASAGTPIAQSPNDSISKSNPLRILTINVWSGLDYHGTLKFGEYESPERRATRFQLLLRQLKEANPDIIFVQEANPVGEYSSALADSLDFDEVHQVCNAGLKIPGFGPPSNFEEGIAILARRSLHLKETTVWKLSGSFGLFGGFMTAHFDESEFALTAEITQSLKHAYLVNVHLSAFPPEDSLVNDMIREWIVTGRIDSAIAEALRNDLAMGSERRVEEVRRLLNGISSLPRGMPLIVGGDFNAALFSAEIQYIIEAGNLRDAVSGAEDSCPITWDPSRNSNITYSTRFTDASGRELDLPEELSAIYDTKPRKIDYIFLSKEFGPSGVKFAQVTIDSSCNEVFASDHFGWVADVELPAPLDPDSAINSTQTKRASIEPLPILSYDTDTHLGYGAKLFLYDLMKGKESFDFVLFNSTKGERWYRMVFSIPDFESREGTAYPVAFDLTFDYDKWLKNNFFGIGNRSSYMDGEQYSREPIEFDMTFSRGFSPSFVGQINLRHENIRDFNFENGSRLETLLPALNSGNVSFSSVELNLRYDSRNSFINPSRGIVVQTETEYSPNWSLGNTPFLRLAGWFQYYSVLFYPTTVFALRLGIQQVIGNNMPVQVMSSLGGTNNLRGYPQDRFLDKADGLANVELRFPIFWRFGGVLGADAGKIWPSLTNIDVSRWAFNPVVGLRLYMDNFVVRADLGFGSEGTGFYFNFGQLF